MEIGISVVFKTLHPGSRKESKCRTKSRRFTPSVERIGGGFPPTGKESRPSKPGSKNG